MQHRRSPKNKRVQCDRVARARGGSSPAWGNRGQRLCAHTHTPRTTVLQVDKRAHSACDGSEQRAKGATADNLESHTSRGDANGGTVAQMPTSKPSPRDVTNVATPDNNSNNEGPGGRSPSLYEVCRRSLLGSCWEALTCHAHAAGRAAKAGRRVNGARDQGRTHVSVFLKCYTTFLRLLPRRR